ncbi:hypothetical protein B7494_g5049 [Chlorociboria aeruginascens]|nr:hypothetical protein B7494_g5049 [Chlorociboria aeruginascens]
MRFQTLYTILVLAAAHLSNAAAAPGPKDFFMTECPADNDTSAVAPRDQRPWEHRKGAYPPCPGWPTRQRYNETHWREWSIWCFCYKYGLITCPMPYAYGWGNGGYAGGINDP